MDDVIAMYQTLWSLPIPTSMCPHLLRDSYVDYFRMLLRPYPDSYKMFIQCYKDFTLHDFQWLVQQSIDVIRYRVMIKHSAGVTGMIFLSHNKV